MLQADCFTPLIFSGDAPERLPSPFAVEPHGWAKQAALHLQARLTHIEHPFGFKGEPDALGKMFGVLVVRARDGRLGYLSAFSGKLGGTNHHAGFVPPVFDILEEHGFFRVGEEELNAINRQIEQLESDPDFIHLSHRFEQEKSEYSTALETEKQRARQAKALRDAQRKEVVGGENQEHLIAESKRDHFLLRDLKKQWSERLNRLEQALLVKQQEIDELKNLRKNKSATLQEQIFRHYSFLNARGEQKSLGAIFQDYKNSIPSAGAGECAAPKLFQFAWKHGYTPLALAEFWWGISPPTEVRKHGHFYPACRGKCLPILTHMLTGTSCELQAPSADHALRARILYEDSALVVLEKPAGMLSVPGKETTHSVQTQLRAYLTGASGPLMVHRLDQATSGLLVAAKTEEIYKCLQAQFVGRKVQKRYVAILTKSITTDSGVIDLPLRVDLDDRPRQMVCYEHGKSARTIFEVKERLPVGCRVEFQPITGRTHQLRVHAAHKLGLDAPIKGDDLYGSPSDRLYLHASKISFEHPITGTWCEFESKPEW